MIKSFNYYNISKIFESILYTLGNFDDIIYYIIDNYPEITSEYRIAANVISLSGRDIKTDFNQIKAGPNNTLVDYIPDSKYNPSNDYSNAKMSNIKIGRMIRKIFLDNDIKEYSDHDFEKFVNAYKTAYNSIYEKSDISIVKGKDIKYWYNINNYASDVGQLGNSCMAASEKNNFFGLYVNNPDVCSLVILKNKEGKLVGRALLWILDNGKTYLDRIYTRYDHEKQIIKKWVEEKDSELLSYDNDDHYSDDIKVTLDNFIFDEYPYMDTFDNLVITLDKDNKIDNKIGAYICVEYSVSKNKMCWKLDNTDGSYNEDYNYIRMKDNSFVKRDVVVYLNEYNEYYKLEDCYMTSSGEYHLKKDCIYSDYLKKYVYKDNVKEVNGNIVDMSMSILLVHKINSKYIDPICIQYDVETKGVDEIFEYEIIYNESDIPNSYKESFISFDINTIFDDVSNIYVNDIYYNKKTRKCITDSYFGTNVGNIFLTKEDIELLEIDMSGANNVYTDVTRNYYLISYYDLDLNLFEKLVNLSKDTEYKKFKKYQLSIIRKLKNESPYNKVDNKFDIRIYNESIENLKGLILHVMSELDDSWYEDYGFNDKGKLWIKDNIDIVAKSFFKRAIGYYDALSYKKIPKKYRYGVESLMYKIMYNNKYNDLLKLIITRKIVNMFSTNEFFLDSKLIKKVNL